MIPGAITITYAVILVTETLPVSVVPVAAERATGAGLIGRCTIGNNATREISRIIGRATWPAVRDRSGFGPVRCQDR